MRPPSTSLLWPANWFPVPRSKPCSARRVGVSLWRACTSNHRPCPTSNWATSDAPPIRQSKRTVDANPRFPPSEPLLRLGRLCRIALEKEEPFTLCLAEATSEHRESVVAVSGASSGPSGKVQPLYAQVRQIREGQKPPMHFAVVYLHHLCSSQATSRSRSTSSFRGMEAGSCPAFSSRYRHPSALALSPLLSTGAKNSPVV